MGKWLSEGNGKKDNSLVKLAYEHDVPIFCPAFTDSSAGFGLVKHQVDAMKRGGHWMTLDSIADFRELTDIKIEAGTTGLLMIGGGVPKNFAQDTVVCAEILGHDDVEVHKYAVQITVADVRDGACSPPRSRRRPAGARFRPRSSRWSMPRRPRSCRCWPATPITAAIGKPRQARLRQAVRLTRCCSKRTEAPPHQGTPRKYYFRRNPMGEGNFMSYSPLLAPVVAGRLDARRHAWMAVTRFAAIQGRIRP